MTTHATRATYQSGCRCTPCRAANARYRVDRYRRRQAGQPSPGQLVSASETWARIRALRAEGFGNRAISGRANRTLPLTRWTRGLQVRLSTALQLRRLCQVFQIDDADLPNHQPGPPEAA